MKKCFIGVAMVKNESDVIEAMLRHNLKVLDRIIICDHLSSDNTKEIIESLISEGLPITLHDSNSSSHDQNGIVTDLMYEAINYWKSNWVVLLDADEFIVSMDNQTHPREILEKLDEKFIYLVGWRTYFLHKKDLKDEILITKRMTYCNDKYYKTFGKVMVSDKIVKKYKPLAGMGNHKLIFKFNYFKRNLYKWNDDLCLAHFPLRSINQLKSKTIIGWLNNLTRDDLKINESEHFKKFFKYFYDEKKDKSIYELQNILAQSYLKLNDRIDIELEKKEIKMPFSKDLELRYTTIKEINYLKNLLANQQEMAIEFSNLKRNIKSVKNSGLFFIKALSGVFIRMINRTKDKIKKIVKVIFLNKK